MSKLALAAAAPKISAAKPTTAGGVLAVIRTLLPLLPFALTSIVQADKSGKFTKIIRQIHAATDI